MDFKPNTGEKKMLRTMEKSHREKVKFGGKTGKQARVDGCNGTLRLTKKWMRDNSIDFDFWQAIFKATGGYCDCEVLLNSYHALGVRT